jgi:hypothetical protein
MANSEFQIEFSYNNVAYTGLVKPIDKNGEIWYAVDLESKSQEEYLQITLKPSNSAIDDWDFIIDNQGAQDASAVYDKDLLTEIGEAIENYQIKGSDADTTVDEALK